VLQPKFSLYFFIKQQLDQLISRYEISSATKLAGPAGLEPATN
jgi:hypothetical protein